MDSILAIDKPCEWEILVGDDGSLDGDDFYTNVDFLTEAIIAFNSIINVSIVAFGYGHYMNAKFTKKFPSPKNLDHELISTESYIRHSYIHSGACVYRKMWDKKRIEYLKRIGYYEDNDIIINSAVYGIQRSPFCFRTAVFRSQRPPIC